MNPNLRILNFVFVSLAFVLFVADRIIKYYFLKNPAIILGGDFFYGQLSFHFVENNGIAFGLPFFTPLLIVLICLILLFLVHIFIAQRQYRSFWFFSGLVLILSGAISNLIDRLKYGFVIDYIDLTWFTVFNLADTMITFGVILYLIAAFNEKSPAKNKFL